MQMYTKKRCHEQYCIRKKWLVSFELVSFVFYIPIACASHRPLQGLTPGTTCNGG